MKFFLITSLVWCRFDGLKPNYMAVTLEIPSPCGSVDGLSLLIVNVSQPFVCLLLWYNLQLDFLKYNLVKSFLENKKDNLHLLLKLDL